MASQQHKTEKFFSKDSSHGEAKRTILKKLLQGWLSFHLYTRHNRLFLIDGFGGEGTYEGRVQNKEVKVEKFGSPVIELDCVLDCLENIKKNLKKQEEAKGISPEMLVKEGGMVEGTKYRLALPFNITLFCVEEQPKTCEKLKANLDERAKLFNTDNNDLASVNVGVKQGKFKESAVINNIDSIVGYEPTLIFLDPFGYSQTPMKTVRRLLGENRTLVITLMVGSINRFKEVRPEQISELYGNDEWKKVLEIEETGTRYKGFADSYMESLENNGAHITWSFPCRNDSNHLVYYLIFAMIGFSSYNILKTLKRALMKVSTKSTEQSFSGYDLEEGDEKNTNKQDNAALATIIFTNFNGKAKDFDYVEKFCWRNTNFCYQAEALKILEDTGRIRRIVLKESEKKRRRGTFANVKELLFDDFRPEFDRNGVCEPAKTKTKLENETLAKIIYLKFKGSSGVTIDAIEWYLLRCGNYKLLTRALTILENEGKLICNHEGEGNKRRKGSYPKNCSLDFLAETPEQDSSADRPSGQIHNTYPEEGMVIESSAAGTAESVTNNTVGYGSVGDNTVGDIPMDDTTVDDNNVDDDTVGDAAVGYNAMGEPAVYDNIGNDDDTFDDVADGDESVDDDMTVDNDMGDEAENDGTFTGDETEDDDASSDSDRDEERQALGISGCLVFRSMQSSAGQGFPLPYPRSDVINYNENGGHASN